MKRREFITLLGGATAWPLSARAQQPAMPVIGYLYGGTPDAHAHRLAAFRKGLNEVGYVEGRNVSIEYRWAQNDNSRLPELAADLVRRRVSVIATPGSTAAAFAAKSATGTIPVVFMTSSDPVQIGFVASLNRPGGNVTGIGGMGVEVAAKRLEILHEILPSASRFAILVREDSASSKFMIAEVQSAALVIGCRIEVLSASSNREIDEAFAALVQKRVEGLVVGSGPLLYNRRSQLSTLASHHRVPAIYNERDYTEVGGLVSYGQNNTDQYRLTGFYVGRILKGENPRDLPVMLPTKFELVINLHTAKTLAIDVPATLIARADEVIE